jgi:uncharacterized membrane protein YcjF (UPF0283 family)
MNVFELVFWGGLAVGLYFVSAWIAELFALNKWIVFGILIAGTLYALRFVARRRG